SENLDVGITNGGKIAVSLVFLAAQRGMKRTEDKVKRPQRGWIHITLADRIEVHLNRTQNGQASTTGAKLAIHHIDLTGLFLQLCFVMAASAIARISPEPSLQCVCICKSPRRRADHDVALANRRRLSARVRNSLRSGGGRGGCCLCRIHCRICF